MHDCWDTEIAALLCANLSAADAGTAFAEPKVITSIDLSKPFGTRSPWLLQVKQGPDTDYGMGPMPGAITLCLSKKRNRACDSSLLTAFPGYNLTDDPGDEPLFGEPHFLNALAIIYPRGTGYNPLLWVQTASTHSIDGNQSTLTQVLTYNRAKDQFFRIYSHLNGGSNNDQEIRFIAAGPMHGDIISVDPTSDAPFAFWVVVNMLTPSYKYRQLLRYRSATHYGDGNRLSVLDSEMPNIQRRLGLWHPGAPPPLPASGCSQPQIIHNELWCH